MARPLRIQFEGALYHVVIRANNRQPLFRDHKDKRHYLELLSRYQGQFGFRIYCYLLVSRQVHLLIETPRGNVGKIMQCLGTSYTAYFNRRHKRHGTLFEGRYKSFLIDNDRYLPKVTRYIHRNSLRPFSKAGQRKNYPWSSYCIYLGRKTSELVETGRVLSYFGQFLRDQQKGYEEFVENDSPTESFYPIILNSEQAGPAVFAKNNFVIGQTLRENRGGETSLRVAARILREISLSLSLTPNELGDLRESRRKSLVRHVAMYLIRKQTNLPLRSIGDLLGVKAPAVVRGIGKVEQLLKREDFSRQIKTLLENNTFPSSDIVMKYRDQRKMTDGSASA